ncbi:N-acetyl-beta-glucosaminyl-glycoprotein 4-beta-N-acetylgalactosaminyltransferase 1-like [Dendronephthya gigantea]|uniref:N-acetyl-beta-glucosaminyl-glycoprotein 4-beta-N-acetylgalactosaminyltransferase 1-like n=1 Tax=Dendronephthya gigantea TaxID=151771 RepID=UPI001069CD9D|nr:N-acetyl-beta-glucosaminyl-glycoprotein 4-beta-N-acetylgalactosaminyltransferase 1-like [Dendronephthya gigantea]
MRRNLMILRRRIIQLILGATVLIFYIQFQLLSFTDRRLFLKRIKLSLPYIPGEEFATERGGERCQSLPSTDLGLQGLTLLTWRSKYITELNSFKDYPLFPKHPASVQFTVKSSLRIPKAVSTGGWLFGLLFAPDTGNYRFALSTNGEAELRLSRTAEPEGTRVIARLGWSDEQPRSGEYSKYSTQTSVSVFLQRCKAYYVEVLFHTRRKDSHVEIAWETPKSLKYALIPMKYFVPYIGPQDIAHTAENLLIFEDNVKMTSLFDYVSRQKNSIENENLDQWRRLPYMLSSHARNMPKCSKDFKGYSAKPRLVLPKLNGKSTENLVNEYTQRLMKRSNGKYSFRGIHHAEEKSLGEIGTRYLMNLEFQDNIMETRIRVSEYIFYENEKSDLCFVDDFTWKRDAMVIIIAVIPTMETWSHYFMDHLSVMTSKLQDSRFSVIIVTSQRLKHYFQTIVTQNTLAWHSRVTLLLMNGNEIRSIASIIKACLGRITTPNAIVFFTNTQVQLPLKILEHVREQTIEGKTAYIPWPENFDKGFQNNATVANPLDGRNPDRPPSFSLYVSDLLKLTGQKLKSKKRHDMQTVWNKGWWQDLVNGTLEIYVSKMPMFYYFQPEL